MISLILYGRNDSYGYNLHKRAAISLNCMAEILTDPSDEIIFVDYNTPDDFPTFPEAIQDTLTPKAKKLLRVLRVRPSQHERFRTSTHLECLEPIARNAGIRRSNPKNRWILSTNTDMVFVSRRGKSLSEIVASLPDAYYHSPRFEVPETLWESVDRIDAPATIAAFESWGRELHLNEIVYAFHPDVRYDGPGDFQLILREDLFRIQGFHESMLLGWHVDSNIARRLALLKRPIGDIVDDLYAYHCDHTRQVTPAHRPRGAQNDQKIFFENVQRADIPEQADTWGLANVTIEEVPLDTGRAYLAALRAAIRTPLEAPTTLSYSGESFNRMDYPPNHVLPFLVDSIASYPRDTVLGWCGTKKTLLEGFSRAWHDLEFTEPIRVAEHARALGPDLPAGCSWSSQDDMCLACTVFVFDWGRPEHHDTNAAWTFDHDLSIRDVMRSFRAAARHERVRLEANPVAPRRFIGINAINNAVEGVFNNHIGAALTPLATHIRQGFLSDVAVRNADVLALLHAGQAGQKLIGAIVALPETEGYIFYGPYLDLDSRTYRLTLQIADVRYSGATSGPLGLEVVSNSRLIAYREISREELANGRIALDFFISTEISDAPDWPRIEFRLRTPGGIALTVRAALLDLIEEPVDVAALGEFDCVPFLSVGPAGVREDRAIRARAGVADLVTYGPYFWLPAGHYEATFRFDVDKPAPEAGIRAYVASHLGRRVLGRAHVVPVHPGVAECTVAFDIGPEVPPPDDGLLEFQVRSNGNIFFAVSAVRVKHVANTPEPTRPIRIPDDHDLLPRLIPGAAGAHVPGAILTLPNAIGCAFSGNDLPAPRGRTRLTMSFGEITGAEAHGIESGLAIAVLGAEKILGYHDIAMDEVQDGSAALEFANDVETVSLRLRSTGLLETEIRSVTLESLDSRITRADAFHGNFLKLLDVGKAGRWTLGESGEHAIIHNVPGITDIVAYGPYVTLAPGRYDVSFELYIDGGMSLRPISIDVCCDLGRRILARDGIWPLRHGTVKRTLSFVVPDETAHREDLYEFRVRAPSRTAFALTGISIEQRSLVALS